MPSLIVEVNHSNEVLVLEAGLTSSEGMSTIKYTTSSELTPIHGDHGAF